MAEIRVSDHPRAQGQIRRAKGLAGFWTFVLVALLAHRAGLAPDAALARALPAGLAAYLVAWFAAVTVWRHLVLAELDALRARREARVAEQHEQVRRLAADTAA